MENILVIGAHYDDAELGVGGTMAKLSKEGKKVYKLTLTDNVTKSFLLNLDVAYETSKLASNQACDILGVQGISTFKQIECTNLFYNTKTMQLIEEIIHKNKIDTVFMHYVDDMNQDHVEAAKLCKTAARHCPNVFTYQSNLYVLASPYYPTVFVDISDYVELKKRALDQYESQHNRFNSLFETTIQRNHVWGYSQKVQYAEAFQVIKMLI